MKVTAELLKRMCDNVNELSADQYFLDFNRVYGGWSLWTKGGNHTKGKYARLERWSNREMYCYLCGLMVVLLNK